MEKNRHYFSKSLVIRLLLLSSIIIGCNKTEPVPSILFNPSVKYGTMTDQDGNICKTVAIGTQIWMAENLKVTKYRNGDSIPTATVVNWENLTTGACCTYDYDASNVKTYGRLYNFYAVHDSRNLAPMGWHVATDAEWSAMCAFLGGDSVAAYKLIETGIGHWTQNDAGTNESGFTALPGGYIGRITYDYTDLSYGFIYKGTWGFWWTSTDSLPTMSWQRDLVGYRHGLDRACRYNDFGFSVRCVKDSN